eukprot:6399248-Alexandrium_andersonii.AAC.1
MRTQDALAAHVVGLLASQGHHVDQVALKGYLAYITRAARVRRFSEMSAKKSAAERAEQLLSMAANA